MSVGDKLLTFACHRDLAAQICDKIDQTSGQEEPSLYMYRVDFASSAPRLLFEFTKLV